MVKRSKCDIRHYGSESKKPQILSEKEKLKLINARIEVLKKSKIEGHLPNLANRVKAGYLIYEIHDNAPIKMPKSQNRAKPSKIQKEGPSNFCFVGADVVSLYPSLRGVEAARLARHTILESDVSVENFDFGMALRYLTIVGGTDMLSKAGLARLAPIWRGIDKT